MEGLDQLNKHKNDCPSPSRHHRHGRVARRHCNVARNGDQLFGFFYFCVTNTSPTFGWILPILSLGLDLSDPIQCPTATAPDINVIRNSLLPIAQPSSTPSIAVTKQQPSIVPSWIQWRQLPWHRR
jgi:hypothetical protein